jgi:uncharacterized protein (DUF486 family)
MTSVTRWAARLVGAGLLGATAGIHAYLWDNGYRSLPKIGPLFLVLIISASILCLVVLATPQRFLGLASLAGAGLLAGTMIGLIIFTNFTIFNFRESTAEMLYWQSITVESIGIVILGGLAAANLSRSPGR